MSIDPTIAVLYAQTGYTARVAHDAATGPYAAGAMSRHMAEETAKLERNQVQSTEDTEGTLIAKDGSQQRGSQFGSRRRNRPQSEAEAENETPSLSDTPLVGNLLNLKV